VEVRLLSRTELSEALALNFLGGEKEMSFRLFGLEWNSRWKTLSIYEKFEQLIVSILTWIIAVIVAVATWQLILHTVSMIRSHLLDPRDSQAFQSLFGMVLTLQIALEFKHSLMVVLHRQRNVVQTRSVILIALLALVRKFIVLDLYQTEPTTVAALAGAALALGIVFWLVRSQECSDETGEGQEPHLPVDC
jgi:uncharacterized membrane protein (DUF373 family)